MGGKYIYFFASLFVLLCLAHGDPVSFISKCTANDSKCIKQSTQAAIPIFAPGLPEYGVPSLDPLVLEKADISSPSLELVLSDVTILGLKGCVAKKVVRDKANSKLSVKLLCDINATGQYVMKGKLLFLAMEGNGPIRVKLNKVLISADLDMGEKVGKDGQKHWIVKKFDHSFELKDKADVVFENLFPNNEVLGRAARELIRDNGNDIVIEVGPPLVKILATYIVEAVNTFFRSVPASELAID